MVLTYGINRTNLLLSPLVPRGWLSVVWGFRLDTLIVSPTVVYVFRRVYSDPFRGTTPVTCENRLIVLVVDLFIKPLTNDLSIYNAYF